MESKWTSFNFNGKNWKPNNNERKHQFRVNGYRVLLTRARQGMILYIPEPSAEDNRACTKNLILPRSSLLIAVYNRSWRQGVPHQPNLT